MRTQNLKAVCWIAQMNAVAYPGILLGGGGLSPQTTPLGTPLHER
jgi:hypothetical protein